MISDRAINVGATTVIVSALIAFLLALKAEKEVHDVAPAAAMIIINPDTTECVYYPGLEQTGWKRISPSDKVTLANTTRPVRTLSAQTLDCVDYGSCPANETKCQLTRFRLREQWYTYAKPRVIRVYTE